MVNFRLGLHRDMMMRSLLIICSLQNLPLSVTKYFRRFWSTCVTRSRADDLGNFPRVLTVFVLVNSESESKRAEMQKKENRKTVDSLPKESI